MPTDRSKHKDITIGTLAPMSKGAAYLKLIKDHGFESYELTMGPTIGDIDLERTAKEVKNEVDAKLSIGLYGNPLQEEQVAKDCRRRRGQDRV